MRDILITHGDPQTEATIRFTLNGDLFASAANQSHSESRSAVANLLKAALMECTPPAFAEAVIAHPCFARACVLAHEDLDAFLAKDPAQRGSTIATLVGSTSYKATLHYRLAHALITTADFHTFANDDLEAYALLLSTRGKLLSGAEIHPRCKIGRRFILDHGWGSVIGETSVVGDDCYMLGGVTLGADGIAGNPSIKRHPTVGDRVQIGAFARVFGNIRIGSDVFIGTHCCITEDIESNSIVTLRSQTQMVHGGAAPGRA
jgi:serine O-acetyltransferase